MKSSFFYSQANITRTGTIARQCLATGRRGKVLAAFSKAIYFVTEDNELFWIAANDVPMHRRCAQISSALPGILAGSSFQVEDHCLILDSGFVVRVDNSALWNAPHIASRNVVDITKLPARIDSLFAYLDLSESKGFGKFIPHIRSFLRNKSASPGFSDPILRFAQPYVLEMASACFNHRPSQILECANSLIGLGSGLTPSGDDFLGGMLFATKIIGTAYPNCLDFVIPIEQYHSRTQLISFTLLKDLANGYAIAPLHHIINGLISGESLESMYAFIRQLIRVGNSTGWDMLSGLLTGLLITYQNNTSITTLPLRERVKA